MEWIQCTSGFCVCVCTTLPHALCSYVSFDWKLFVALVFQQHCRGHAIDTRTLLAAHLPLLSSSPLPSSFSILWAAALLYKRHGEQIKIDGQSCEMWALGDAPYRYTFSVRIWSSPSRQRILCRPPHPTSILPSLDHSSNSIGDRQELGFLDAFFPFPYKRVVCLSALIMLADAHCG